jgi:hypothetical protein
MRIWNGLWNLFFLSLKVIQMRTLLKATLEVTASNNAIKDGSLPKLMQQVMERLKPEASYFTAMDGCRTCIMVFDLKDPSEIPSIAEPFFLQLNAKVEFSPVMNADDLKKGLELWQQSAAKPAMSMS